MDNRLDRLRQSVFRWPVAIIIVLAFVAGFLLRGGPEPAYEHGSREEASGQQARVQEWTCSMHPQIRQPKAGQCPICGMDLIPVTEELPGDELGPGQIRVSEASKALAGIQVAPVERKHLPVEVRMVGKIDYDETRRRYIAAWVAGRLDRLFVDFTGTKVKKDDPLVSLYSPELFSAQEELFQALKGRSQFEQSTLSTVRSTASLTVEASREKLRLLGLNGRQIEQIEKSGKPSTHLTISSPISGTVVHKNATEGMYVSTGTTIYIVADLSRLWVQLQAYESDLPWLKLGQAVEFTGESYSGETFKGKISFIDPVVDPNTRTVRVRLDVSNTDGRLKPEMFVRAVVKSYETSAGDHAAEAHQQAPLVIPASAPLITGTRAVVYVAVEGKTNVFEGREVVLGPRTGDYYIVRQGLNENELVVVNGNFKIDSAIQILGRKSMMNPEGGGPAPGHDHGSAKHPAATESTGTSSFETPAAFKMQLHQVNQAYFKIHRSLSGDSFQGVGEQSRLFIEALDKVDMSLLKGQAYLDWMKYLESLKKAAESVAEATDIAQARESFSLVSKNLAEVVQSFGAAGATPVVLFHCPMAFDNRGALWLQDDGETANPYFGASMLRCRDRIDTLYTGNSGIKNKGHGQE